MTSLLQNTRRHDISFHQGGCIDITARIAKALGLQAGDVIDIAVDGSECYLYIKHKARAVIGRHEAQIYPTSKAVRRCNNMRCHSKRLCAAIMEICGSTGTTRLNCGDPVTINNGTLAIPVITRRPAKQNN